MGHFVLLVPLCLTIAAAAIDVRRREIPDVLPILVAFWGITLVVAEVTGRASAIGGAMVASIFGGLLYFACGFGGGDAKLIAALGCSLGPIGVLWTALYMALAGGVLGLVAKGRGQRTFAYGPAIAIGLAGYVTQKWTT